MALNYKQNYVSYIREAHGSITAVRAAREVRRAHVLGWRPPVTYLVAVHGLLLESGEVVWNELIPLGLPYQLLQVIEEDETLLVRHARESIVRILAL